MLDGRRQVEGGSTCTLRCWTKQTPTLIEQRHARVRRLQGGLSHDECALQRVGSPQGRYGKQPSRQRVGGRGGKLK
jgi:hypothetical protein